MKVKVKGKEYSVKNINLDLRMEILDEAMLAAKEQKFSSFVNITRKVIDVTDEQLMEMSTEEISQLGARAVEICDAGKKPMKSKSA